MVIRVLGSIALELCLVAEGAIDAVVDIRDLINGYDIAGAALILHEAGGVLTNLQGEEFATEVGNAHNLSLIAALEHTMHARMHALVNSR
jgi:myo-inositol-1(or 4)-monophosphatase